MQHGLSFERFDQAAVTDHGPSQDFHDGYALGLVAGQDAARAEADQLRRDVAQSLNAIACTYDVARGDVLASFDRLMMALTATVLPHCVAHGFGQQITDLVVNRFADDIGAEITIHVHPDQVASVQNAVSAAAGSFKVTADPTLSPFAAWIGRAQDEIYLDLDQMLADITQLLSNVSTQNQRMTPHG